jgi:glutamate synthase domain-containing protein 2/glutamate synthase domain-containing protein 1/glutamate synthase domain-containing protein 3
LYIPANLVYSTTMGRSRHKPPVDHDACGVGFIAQLGTPAGSREVVERALEALRRLSHRGGVDADGSSGDGAGLLTPIPDKFFRARAGEAGIELPERYGLGVVFLSREGAAATCSSIEEFSRAAGLRCLGWRTVPTNPGILGPSSAATQPVIRQVFFEADSPNECDLERRLFFLRKRVEFALPDLAYFASLSSRTVVYKGLLAPEQLPAFYSDLAASEFHVPFAIFHQRYSTNTRPTWRLAQPFRYVAHNGEINTIGANRRWMQAREQDLRRQLGAGDWLGALENDVSDSASFDNAFEILLRLEYSPAAAMLRMVPPAWESDATLASFWRDYLAAQAREQEPWDGPAALVFSDGRTVGAKLDRNGLRPLRYSVTADGLVILGSEVGVASLEGKKIIERERLGPGEMVIVDPASGKILRGNALANTIHQPADGALTRKSGSGKHSGARTVLHRAPAARAKASSLSALHDPKRIAAALGWTEDQFRILFQPLARDGKEAVWSMGDDAPPAFLSSARRPLWDYCKQSFAQVTNPAIDPLREAHVMSLETCLGGHVIANSPLLDAAQMAAVVKGLLGRVCWIDFTFEAGGGAQAAAAALERVRHEAHSAASAHSRVVALSDKTANPDRAALPALLACSAAWKGMLAAGLHDVPLIVETGQVVETHHVALLIAVGASAVSSYLALELAEATAPGGAESYLSAVEAGLKKVLARMGISTLSSYRNSRLFTVVGLDADVCDEYFEDAASVLGGKTLGELFEDSLSRHVEAFGAASPGLQDSGLYRFRQTGERHGTSPELMRRLHKYIREPGTENYRAYSELADTREPVAVRDLLDFAARDLLSLDEVEPADQIVRRFSTQAMSLGALGPEAHRTLAIAMNRLDARSNTGEGGEDPSIYVREPEAANRVKQVASGRFGVTTEYLVQAGEIEVKMAQGSKPGEGGQIPAAKVTPYIARLRHASPGMSLISPPPHHDIYSIEDLAQLIHDLRAVNPRARIGVKLVSGAGVGIIAAGVAKAGAHVVTISGFDGGTGASPLTSIKNTGLPWEVGLRDAHNTLLRSGFRRRVRLRVDGGFKSGRDVVLAALLGADEFGFGTAALLAIGCVMARQCHLNTCPAGIATQDEKYRERFAGKPEMVMTYFKGVATEVRELLAKLGARSIQEIVGDVERLKFRTPRAASIFGDLLDSAEEHASPSLAPIDDYLGINVELDHVLIGTKARKVRRHFSIANSDRSVGARFSGELLRRSWPAAPGRCFDFEFRGSAGQSFGAFLVPGVNFRLVGEANDYVGKGLSGGRIAITAGAAASRRGDVLAGNTVLYGATRGELYIAGRAGERFAVRNSGALAVVEGIGQHGCEYMTAGVVIILGPAGANFGSGMTGGLSYVLADSLPGLSYHREFLKPEAISEFEQECLRRVLSEHFMRTGSPRAEMLLDPLRAPALVRLAPIHRALSIEETWLAALDRLEKPEPMPVGALSRLLVESPLVPVA